MGKWLRILAFFLLPLGLLAHEGERSFVFLPNKGQFHPNVVYETSIRGGKIFLEKDGFTFHLQDHSAILDIHHGKKVEAKDNLIRGHSWKMQFLGAQSPQFATHDKAAYYYNYFLGNDPAKWASEVYGYHEVKYGEIYPGISVVLHTEDEHLKYDLLVKAGADISQIRQQYTGQNAIGIQKNGDLLIRTSVGDIFEKRPIAWQTIKGKKVAVEVNFVLNNNVISYAIGDGYDPAYDLVIDPVLIFGSYTGSTADNFGMTATYDSQGNFITGGMGYNIGYPTTPGAYQVTPTVNGTTYGVTDVVITKFNPTGTNLLFSTYLGGGTGTGGTETVHSLIVDDNDDVLLFGVTSSTDFPVTAGCYDNTYNGGTFIGFVYNGTYFNNGTDLYVSKLNSTGTTLMASTYIGGSGNDGVNYNFNQIVGGNWNSNYDSLQFNYGDQFRGEIMVDDLGNVYIASTTKSSDFPTQNALQSSFGGVQDAVAFKFDPNLSTLQWSTFLGGANKDAGYSIKVDDTYNAYIGGGTASSDFPSTPGALNTTYQGGKTDGFIAKISPTGNTLLASSFIGTSLYDQIFFVELDRFGSVYILGQTLGITTYPVVNVAYSNLNSGQFITKLDNALSTMTYSTLFGNGNGNVNLSPSAFLVDVCGNVYVSGWGANILQSTQLTGMPTTPDAVQPGSGDGFNFYLIVFSRDIGSLLYATYFGGNLSREHVDGGTSRFDANGIVYQSVCAGCSNNDDFPTTPGAWSNTNNSTNCNNGVFKFDFELEPEADFTTDLLEGCAPLTIQFDNTSPSYSTYLWDFGNGDTTSTDIDPIRIFNTPGTYIAYLIVEDSICGLLDTAQKVITVYPELQLFAGNDTVVCEGTSLNLLASTFGTVNQFIWSSNGNFSDTLNTQLSDSTLNVTITTDTVFYVQVGNVWCEKIDTIFISLGDPNFNLSNPPGICTGDTAVIAVLNLDPSMTLNYDWGPDPLILSGDGTPSVQVSPDSTSWITVTVVSNHGCTITDSVQISVSGPPTGLLEATADAYTILPGQSTTLHASPNSYSYSWVPPFNLNNPTSQHPIASPDQTTIYEVTVSNNGCSLTDTVMIRVLEFVCGEPSIFVPNAFTPNGDGENDILYVRGVNIEILFRVYDRWGEKVFESTDLNYGWDGKFRDKECDPAVYVYYLEVLCPGEEKYFKKGNVTLIR